jgi:hypothetical protein
VRFRPPIIAISVVSTVSDGASLEQPGPAKASMATTGQVSVSFRELLIMAFLLFRPDQPSVMVLS